MAQSLGRWVGFCSRHWRLTLLLGVLLAAGSIWLAVARLGVTTDTSNLFSASLPWRQRTMTMDRAFPGQQDLLIAVVDGAAPEEADVTANQLAAALAADKAHFRSVRRPDTSPYLERNALLFLDTPELRALLDQTIDAQPFLGQLAADPTLRGLLAALGLIAEGVSAGQADLGSFAPALEGFHNALAQAAAGHPEPLSWERLLTGKLADMAGQYRFLEIRPALDFTALEPGHAASEAIRAAAAKLEFVQAGRARVRLTGNVALEDQEFSTVANGAVTSLVLSLCLVTLWLFLAVRTWRLVVPIVLTLLLGLLLTTGFAALAVGTLNLVSVAFAVLFTGIAVDFSIQFAVRYREAGAYYRDGEVALGQTGKRAGSQILVAALASTAGFLAFTPTNFVGVAQLGLIAGVGMLVAFCCTLTFLPALLSLMHPPIGRVETGLPWIRPLDPFLDHRRRPVVLGFAALGLIGVLLLPRIQFDSDPLHTKDPTTESVRTLRDLEDDPIANPYTIDVLTPSLDAAQRLATRLEQLPTVDSTLSLDSFVPTDQAAKLPMLQDAASLLATTLDPAPPPPPPTAAELRAEIGNTAAAFLAVRDKLPAGSPILPLIADLQTLAQASDSVLLATNLALTRFLPMQLDRLRTALQAGPATVADVPADLQREWLLPDGRAKLEVVPKKQARDSAGLHRFVAEVEGVAPDAAGSAVSITGSADTITAAFRMAAILALLACAALLGVALRHLLDMVLVLAPLLVSSLLTVVVIVLLPLPLNFANIIALPLLLGVGVSFNVYFVMNWRARRSGPLGSATARAVLFSALTTATAFGSLAVSRHPGTRSMGELLLISLLCTLLTTLLFLPALLAWLGMPAIALRSRRWLELQQSRAAKR